MDLLHPSLLASGALEQARGRRIYLAHGARDWMFPIGIARLARETLEKTGAELVYREIPDLSHTYAREENARILQTRAWGWIDLGSDSRTLRPPMYAVVRTGGKQLRVSPGDLVKVELLAGSPGDRIELEEVLLVGGDEVKIGTPRVAGAKVVATIRGETKGPKVRIFKHKRRKRYRLHRGHRQRYTELRIDSIEV